MMTYLIVFIIALVAVLVGSIFAIWQYFKYKDEYMADNIWRRGIATFLIVGGLFFWAIGSGFVADSNYVERIEARYNIHVVENQNDDDYAFVVYNEGKCVARKAPEDTLIGVGCNPIPDELPRS